MVRNRKEVKAIDVEEVEMLRGLGHQSSIKAQCAPGEHVLQIKGQKRTLRSEGKDLQRRRALGRWRQDNALQGRLKASVTFFELRSGKRKQLRERGLRASSS